MNAVIEADKCGGCFKKSRWVNLKHINHVHLYPKVKAYSGRWSSAYAFEFAKPDSSKTAVDVSGGGNYRNQLVGHLGCGGISSSPWSHFCWDDYCPFSGGENKYLASCQMEIWQVYVYLLSFLIRPIVICHSSSEWIQWVVSSLDLVDGYLQSEHVVL